MKIRSDNTAESNWYLIEVIAYIIRHLKDMLLGHLSMNGSSISAASDFHWVITVPAIWQARGKAMMREAGYLVYTLCVLSIMFHFSSYRLVSVEVIVEYVTYLLDHLVYSIPEKLSQLSCLWFQSLKQLLSTANL